MIWLGCSGWSYKEWSGVFYPSFVRDQLKYYSQRFNSVEINSTFYGEPDRNIARSWCSKIGERRDFRFSIFVSVTGPNFQNSFFWSGNPAGAIP